MSLSFKIDLCGRTFGRLTVLDFLPKVGTKYSWWKCRCRCGKRVSVMGNCMVHGGTRSCGCLRLENITKHGLTGTGIFRIWGHIVERCECKTHKSYPNYGARGIGMCKKWRVSPLAFANDMGPRPSARHSVDRKDNNGNYCPSNCRWATSIQQNNNTRRNLFLELDGVRKTAAQWYSTYGVNKATFHGRLRRGWDMRRAVKSLPTKVKR